MFLAVIFWWALSTAVALLVGFQLWRSGRRWIGLAAKWGCISGFGGLAIGLLVAFIWFPDANQGFLLGLFVTGPAAFAATVTTLLVIGAIQSSGPVRSALPRSGSLHS